MSLEALDKYLTFLWVPDPLTMFEGIRKLPAGHYALWQGSEFKIEQYWDLTFPPAEHLFERAEADLAEEIRARFCASVEQQMVSDVPIGAFLSAGLDSSSIAAAMVATKARKQPVRTYTITFPEKYRVGETTIDDPGVPQRLARKLGCEHHEIVVEPDVVGLLPSLTWHMDEPTADPAIIAAYLVCREARKQATVLLSGVGGDEIFAGYRKHAAHAWAEEYQRVPGFARSVAERALLALPSLRGTPHERSGASGEEDGAQRGAQPGGSIHQKLHVSGCAAEGRTYMLWNRSRRKRQSLATSIWRRSTKCGTRIFSTRCSIWIPRFS